MLLRNQEKSLQPRFLRSWRRSSMSPHMRSPCPALSIVTMIVPVLPQGEGGRGLSINLFQLPSKSKFTLNKEPGTGPSKQQLLSKSCKQLFPWSLQHQGRCKVFAEVRCFKVFRCPASQVQKNQGQVCKYEILGKGC